MSIIILNLGCGKKLINGAVNVDFMPGPGINKVVDLSLHSWPWKNSSVDGIHASHIIEHFVDQKKFIMECHRILKPGGFLRIVGPHASCIMSVGCLGHHRTYSLRTFDDYLTKAGYMFIKPLFKTKHQWINWWYEASGDNIPKWVRPIIWCIDKPLSHLINLAPSVYENFFAGVIQSREVVWEGVKCE